MKKNTKAKNSWTLVVFVLISAVLIYWVATQAGLAVEEVNSGNQAGFTFTVTKPAVTKTPAVPVKNIKY